MEDSEAFPVLALNALVLSFAPLRGVDLAHFQCSWATELEGHVSADQVEHALLELVRAHEALRTVLDMTQNPPVERVFGSGGVLFDAVDARGRGTDAYEWALEAARSFAMQPADVAGLPGLRCRAIQITETRWLLQLSASHLFVDGWSSALLAMELQDLVQGEAAAERAFPPALSYREYLRQPVVRTDEQRREARALLRAVPMMRRDDHRGLVRKRSARLALRDHSIWMATFAVTSTVGGFVLKQVGQRALNKGASRMAASAKRGRATRGSTSAPAAAVERRDGVPSSVAGPYASDLAPGHAASRVHRMVATADCLQETYRYARAKRATISAIFGAAVASGFHRTLQQDTLVILNATGRVSPNTFGTVGNLMNLAFLVSSGRSVSLEDRMRELQRQMFSSVRVLDHVTPVINKSREEQRFVRDFVRTLLHPSTFAIVFQVDAEAAVSRPRSPDPVPTSDRLRPAITISDATPLAAGATLAVLDKFPFLHVAVSTRQGQVEVYASFDHRQFDPNGVRELLRCGLEDLLQQVTQHPDASTG